MKKIFSVVATIISLVALVQASSASFLFWHQPKTPKTLRK